MTGSRGPISKPDNQRQRRNKRTPLVLEHRGLTPPVPKDAGFLAITAAQWKTFWESDLGKVMREEHMPMVTRLFFRYDERERATRAVRKQRITKGSNGQPVLNPLWKIVDTCDAEIRQLEDRIGLSPKSRVQIGGAAARAQATLDDMNRDLEDDENVSDDSSIDPRIAGQIRR